MSWNLEESISYYHKQGAPRDQNALISLLKETQQEQGSIPQYAITAIAEAYGIKEGILLALIKRIPSLRLSDAHVLELCAGHNCSKYTALADFAEKLVKHHPNVQLKFVPCMRLCAKGPNVKWDGKLYHGADEALLRELLED